MTEDELITQFLRPLVPKEAFNLQDDGAVLPSLPQGREWVLSTDCMMADVHLPLNTDLEMVAEHLLRVNLSDMAAMAAIPRYILVQLGLPQKNAKQGFQQFAQGLQKTMQHYKLELLGGDTISLPPLMDESGCQDKIWMAGATIIGERDADKRVLRAGAKAGDILAVTGNLGDAVLGLKILQNNRIAFKFQQQYPHYYDALLQAYYRPIPQIEAGLLMGHYANALMDVSDGVFQDAGRMLRASRQTLPNLDLKLDDASLPISNEAKIFLEFFPKYRDDWRAGGGDYQLLCAVPEENFAQLQQKLQQLATPVTLSAIGAFTDADSGDSFFNRVDLPKSWDHFS
ncbi:MAG: thiamine-phosphate kinase [Alphaproteobacteria bacterium]|nr:thiamine-phosphate kinase [Alphaproteobacteria bacterium]